MNRSIFLFLMVIQLFLASAYGEVEHKFDCGADFKSAAESLIAKVQRNGWSELDGRPISTFRELISSSAVPIVCSRNSGVVQNNRKDAIWINTPFEGEFIQAIQLSSEIVRSLSDSSIRGSDGYDFVAGLAVHEYLAKFFREEQDYALSVALIFMARHRFEYFENSKIFDKLADRLPSSDRDGEGGSTGAGGGGDLNDIRWRYHLIKAYIDREIAKVGRLNPLSEESRRYLYQLRTVHVEIAWYETCSMTPKYQYSDSSANCIQDTIIGIEACPSAFEQQSSLFARLLNLLIAWRTGTSEYRERTCLR